MIYSPDYKHITNKITPRFFFTKLVGKLNKKFSHIFVLKITIIILHNLIYR